KSLLSKQAEEEVYSESLYGYRHFSTAALFSLRADKYKYIDAPKPELYDLGTDPAEEQNLYPGQRELAKTYQNRLNALRSRFQRLQLAGEKAPSAEVVTRLRSLGYLAGSPASSRSLKSGPDPKDALPEYAEYRRAVTLLSVGRIRESSAALESLLAR